MINVVEHLAIAEASWRRGDFRAYDAAVVSASTTLGGTQTECPVVAMDGELRPSVHYSPFWYDLARRGGVANAGVVDVSVDQPWLTKRTELRFYALGGVS